MSADQDELKQQLKVSRKLERRRKLTESSQVHDFKAIEEQSIDEIKAANKNLKGLGVN